MHVVYTILILIVNMKFTENNFPREIFLKCVVFSTVKIEWIIGLISTTLALYSHIYWVTITTFLLVMSVIPTWVKNFLKIVISFTTRILVGIMLCFLLFHLHCFDVIYLHCLVVNGFMPSHGSYNSNYYHFKFIKSLLQQ